MRYQRGSQNPYIEKEEEEEEDEEEEQTTQWPKENVQKDKQRSRKHTYKIKDRVSQTPLNSGGELSHQSYQNQQNKLSTHIGNVDSCLGPAKTFGGIKPVNWIPMCSLLIIVYPKSIQM